MGGTCGSIHIESFHKNMKALGFRSLRASGNRTKCYQRSYFALKGGARSKGGTWENLKGWNMCASTYMRNEGTGEL